jgi:hypothetical protein
LSFRNNQMDSEKNQVDEDAKTEYLQILEETKGQVIKDIIDHYDQIQSQIDVRTETLLLNLPEAMKNAKQELLEQLNQEKERCLAALGPESAVVKYKNQYYERFLQLKHDYYNSGNDLAKKQEIQRNLDELKKDLQVLEEFLEDFKNRTLCFEEADKSLYASLIGELVTNDETNTDSLEISNETK